MQGLVVVDLRDVLVEQLRGGAPVARVPILIFTIDDEMVETDALLVDDLEVLKPEGVVVGGARCAWQGRNCEELRCEVGL